METVGFRSADGKEISTQGAVRRCFRGRTCYNRRGVEIVIVCAFDNFCDGRRRRRTNERLHGSASDDHVHHQIQSFLLLLVLLLLASGPSLCSHYSLCQNHAVRRGSLLSSSAQMSQWLKLHQGRMPMASTVPSLQLHFLTAHFVFNLRDILIAPNGGLDRWPSETTLRACSSWQYS